MNNKLIVGFVLLFITLILFLPQTHSAVPSDYDDGVNFTTYSYSSGATYPYNFSFIRAPNTSRVLRSYYNVEPTTFIKTAYNKTYIYGNIRLNLDAVPTITTKVPPISYAESLLNYTISFWVKNLNESTKNNISLYSQQFSATNPYYYKEIVLLSNNTYRIDHITTTTTSVYAPRPTSTFNDWTHIIYMKNGTQELLYENGVKIYTSTYLNSTRAIVGSNDVSFFDGPNSGYTYSSNMGLGDIYWYNRSLTPAEITSIYQTGFVSPITVTAKDSFNSTPLTTFNVSFYNGTYFNYTTTNGSIVSEILSNTSSLFNITYSADNYFSKTYENVNLSTGTHQGSLTGAYITFTPRELFTNNSLLGNVTVSGQGATQTSTSNNVFNLTQGNFTINVSVPSYYNKSFSVEVLLLENKTVNLTNIYNSILKVNATSRTNNTAINTFTTNIKNSVYGSLSGSTTNGSYFFNILNGTWLVNTTSSGYFRNETNVSVITGTQTNHTASLYPYGTLGIIVRKTSDGNILSTQPTTITVENTTTQTITTVTNGTGNITGLGYGSYILKFNSSGYANVSYNYNYFSSDEQAPSSLTAYMTQATSQVIFTITSQSGTPIQGALVTIYTFVNGTMQLIGSQTTDFVGQTAFSLFLNTQTYRISISATDYSTRTDLTTLLSTTYDVALDPLETFNFDQSSLSNITYSYNPTSYQIEPEIVSTFNWTVVGDHVTVEDVSIRIYNSTGSLLYSITNTTDNPSMLTASIDTAALNLSTIIVQYAYTKEGYDEEVIHMTYYIAPKSYVGSIAEARTWAQTNISVGWRIFLWFFFGIFCSAALLSTFIRGVGAALGTLGVGMFAAYVLAIPLGWIGIGGIVIALYIVATSNSGV